MVVIEQLVIPVQHLRLHHLGLCSVPHQILGSYSKLGWWEPRNPSLHVLLRSSELPQVLDIVDAVDGEIGLTQVDEQDFNQGYYFVTSKA